jgi:arginase
MTTVTLIAVPFHLDEPLPAAELPGPADHTVAPTLPAGTPWHRMAALYAEVATAVAGEVAAGRTPVVASGDCTTALGAVAGVQRAGVDPMLIWIDGHGDLQTEETSASGYLGGMPLRQLVGGADRTVADHVGLRTLSEEDVLLVDARDLDPAEVEFLSGSAIRRCAVEDVGDTVPAGRPLHLHLDVDVTDPGDLPDLLFPTPHGPGLDAVAATVRGLLATGSVVAVTLGCTWRPGSAAAGHVHELAAEMVATLQ